VIELNRAVAVAMRDGPKAGLSLIDPLLERGELAGYHLAHAARADLCRRLGPQRGRPRAPTSARSPRPPGAQQRFLRQRIAALG
jgi:RNA polymerase sigma-70 factor (ECF subfamily)